MMKRNYESSKQRATKASKKKRVTAVAVVNHATPLSVTVPIGESFSNRPVEPSFHRTLMRQCQNDLQLVLPTEAPAQLQHHEISLPSSSLRHQSSQHTAFSTNHDVTRACLNDNHVAVYHPTQTFRTGTLGFPMINYIDPLRIHHSLASMLSIDEINSTTNRGLFLERQLQSTTSIVNQLINPPISSAILLASHYDVANEVHMMGQSAFEEAQLIKSHAGLASGFAPMEVGTNPTPTSGTISLLPSCIATPIDVYKLSPHQCLLRQQIEYFEANYDDTMVPIRGRNKPVSIGQVGIRCKHCAHVPMSYRQKGSTYFPSSKLGIYQAAQNMSTTHLQCGLCNYTPDEIKNQFASIMADRKRNDNGAGRPYWAKSATQSGFIDTEEHGIRCIHADLPLGSSLTESDKTLLRDLPHTTV